MPWRRIPHLIDQAYMQAGHGDYAAAVETMRQALAIDSDHSRVYACLAQFLLWDSKEKAAWRAIQRALELEPDSSFIQRVAGDIFSVMFDQARAEAAYLQAIELDPSDADNHNALAAYYWRHDRIRDALDLTEKARQLEPSSLQTAILRGEILLGAGKVNEAAVEAEFALRKDPESYAAALLMAKTSLVRNDLETARELAISALMRNPRDDDAFVLLAKIKSRQNPILGLWWRLHLLMRPLRTNWGIGLSLAGLALFAAATEPPERGGFVLQSLPPDSAAMILDYRTAAWAVILSIASIALLGHYVTQYLVWRERRKVELDQSF